MKINPVLGNIICTRLKKTRSFAQKKAVEIVFLSEAIDHSALYFLCSGRKDFKALSINIRYNNMSQI